jgi:uncharacterized metal-binding protein
MSRHAGPVVLVTCSGISNTGKCTDRAATLFRQMMPHLLEEHIAASSLPELSPEAIAGCRECRVMVVDGCGDGCAAKKAALCGLDVDIHVIATDHGIVKSGMDEPCFAAIDSLARLMARLCRD